MHFLSSLGAQPGWSSAPMCPSLPHQWQGHSSEAELPPHRAQHDCTRLVRRTCMGSAMSKKRSKWVLGSDGQGWLGENEPGGKHCPDQCLTLSMKAAKSIKCFFWLPVLSSRGDARHNLLEQHKTTIFPGTRSRELVACGDAPRIVAPQPGKEGSLSLSAEPSDLPIAGNYLSYEHTHGKLW